MRQRKKILAFRVPQFSFHSLTKFGNELKSCFLAKRVKEREDRLSETNTSFLAQIKPVEKSLILLAPMIPEKAKRCVERELCSKNGYSEE